MSGSILAAPTEDQPGAQDQPFRARLTMSLRARLQLFILALVVTVVVALSALHVRDLLATRFEDAHQEAGTSAEVVESILLSIVNEETVQRSPSPTTVEDLTRLWTRIVEQDARLASLLQKMTGTSALIIEIVVTGENDRILAASLPSRKGQKLEPPPDFEQFRSMNAWERLNALLSPNEDYQVSRPLGVSGRQVLNVRVILSTVLLRNAVMPQMIDLAIVSAVSLAVSLLAAILAANLAFRPLERIGAIIDRIARGESAVEPGKREAGSKEEAVVESKLTLLGERFRGAQADVSEMRTNIDQLLDRMEEAVLFFGRDDRLVMAGRGAERLLGWGRWEVMGKTLDEIFPASTSLGALVQGAVHVRREVVDRPVKLARPSTTPAQLLVTVELVEDFVTHQRAGALVTLRDAAPRREIESQLDVSARLAAISRLTSGAAHEIKNPLNSIALHLEVLRSKLDSAVPEAESEIEVIGREIMRLDRVVKSFLDFTRPVELEMQRVDLGVLAREVASLVRPDAASRRVDIVTSRIGEEAFIQGDRDLLKQAVLNVVVNGVEAMQDGGRLELTVEQTAGAWLLTVRDEGVGVPAELREKIYNLYFTTKGKGSGIGLAMTFRVVQLHGGTIDFTSKQNEGTMFRLTFPPAKEDARKPPALTDHATSRESAT